MADPRTSRADEASVQTSALGFGGNADQGGDQNDAAEWKRLVSQHQKWLRTHEARGEEHTRLEGILGDLPKDANPIEIEKLAVAVAAAERAYSKAGNQCDALMLQIMATPAPHAEALAYKTNILKGEDYDYIGYAVDGLFDIYASDALFFAGVGERASRDVLNQFVAELPDFIANREQRDDAQYAKAVAEAKAETAKARKNSDDAACYAGVEAQIGTWLDAVDAGGGRLWDDDPAKGIYLVWASTDLKQPSWDLPASKLAQIREQRALAMSLVHCALKAWPLPGFVARMREWSAFKSLNGNLEIERHDMTRRALQAARAHGIEEMILHP